MGNVYGTNYQKAYVDQPPGKYALGEYNGNLKILKDSAAMDADVKAIGEKIFIGKLPKGATPLFAVVKSPSLGTTGIMKFGSATDEDGLVASADAGGQAVHAQGDGSMLGTKLTEETEVYIEFTEATDSAEGDVVQAWVGYILE